MGSPRTTTIERGSPCGVAARLGWYSAMSYMVDAVLVLECNVFITRAANAAGVLLLSSMSTPLAGRHGVGAGELEALRGWLECSHGSLGLITQLEAQPASFTGSCLTDSRPHPSRRLAGEQDCNLKCQPECSLPVSAAAEANASSSRIPRARMIDQHIDL